MNTRWLASALAVLIAPLTFADELFLHGLTYHGRRHYEEFRDNQWTTRHYNEVNPGVGYAFDNGLILGTYRNSYYKQSVYGVYRYMFNDNFGVFAGYASNYQNHGGNALRGGLLVRSNDLGNGWRVGLLGQPIQTSNIEAIVSAYVSKDM
ncbi:hypothetical protein [Chitinimonas sp.]|uniref:hypothetical protein n=1 Tax=Chitinimonas sp. TaxID=1934313 RepID=UPI002F91EF30